MPEFKTVAGQRFVRYRRNDSIIWAVLAVALVGAGVLGIGVRDSLSREAFLAKSVAASGVVTHREAPVVQFTPVGAANPVILHASYLGNGHYTEGETVTVRYLPQNPESADLEEVLLSHTVTAGYILTGAILMLGATGLLSRLCSWMTVRQSSQQMSFR